MVFIPQSGVTPLDPAPVMPVTAELELNRNLTNWFIQQDPTAIALIPQNPVRQSGGGFEFVALPPRPAQNVKLIAPADNGLRQSEGGFDRKFDFVLLAEWDATVKLNDFWEDDEGNFWTINGLYPYNGYEVKATAVAYGVEIDG